MESRDSQHWSICPSGHSNVCMNVFEVCFASLLYNASVFMYAALFIRDCGFEQSVPGRACMTVLFMFVCVVQRSICHPFSVKG